MTGYYNSMKEFFEQKKGKVLRYWVYKRMFTPYETKMEFSCETCYESEYASDGILCECVPLQNGDYLIGFSLPESDSDMITYYKLSEIRIMYCESDQE